MKPEEMISFIGSLNSQTHLHFIKYYTITIFHFLIKCNIRLFNAEIVALLYLKVNFKMTFTSTFRLSTDCNFIVPIIFVISNAEETDVR
jgi:hypothetical protein